VLVGRSVICSEEIGGKSKNPVMTEVKALSVSDANIVTVFNNPKLFPP
jgi:hypothetical protein